MTDLPTHAADPRHVLLATLPVLLAAALLRTAPAAAQDRFALAYGGPEDDRAHSVQETADGGYIVAGVTHSFGAGGADAWLIKTDAYGDTLWTRTFGGDGLDAAYAVQQTTDGGYIVAGVTRSFGAGGADARLIKTDAYGDTLWTRTFGGPDDDEAFAVLQAADLGYLLAGVTRSFGAGGADAWLIKTDAYGDTLWTRTFGGTEDDGARSVDMTTDGGYVLAGTTASFGGGGDNVVLIKTGADGTMMWTRTFGGADADSGSAVRRTRDGGCIVTGSTRSIGAGEMDVYLVRTDFSGNLIWEKTVGGPGIEAGRDVRETREGGFVIAGTTYSPGAGGADARLIKTDADGDTLWTRTFGGPGADAGLSVRQTTDRGYILAGGTTSSGAGGDDAWLVKTDPNGATGIGDGQTAPLPRAFRLAQNRPNPFNPSTTIGFTLPDAPPRRVSLAVYDLRGRRVRTLVDSALAGGDHRVHWDGRDEQGRTAASGAYLCRLEAGGSLLTRKMLLVR
jgi:hypothetical protein